MVRGRLGFRYQPALDGVRGVAVALVLLFHGGFTWMPGGYVGVSVFFTLSGYLITSLALVEHEQTGGVDARAFYARRIRRLLPASLLCLVAVSLMAWRGWFLDDTDLRRDLWGALLQVANWVDLASGDSYADLVSTGQAAGSPLDHYWSLAIEEQFYWVWPLALLLLLRLRPAGRCWAFGGLAVTGALLAAGIAAGFGADAAYWATPARLGEILVGAALAVVLHHRPRALPPATGLLAPAGLIVIVWAANTWPSGRGPAYDGWLPVFALASAALIVGLQVRSPWRRLASWRPLVALGAISYGVYLFHWPIFLAIDERTGLPIGALFAVRVTVTLAVAVLSFVLLERPIRTAASSGWVTARAGLVGAAAVALAIAVVPLGRQLATSSGDGTAAADRGADLAVVSTTSSPPAAPLAAVVTPTTSVASTTVAAPSTVPSLPAALTRPVRVLVVGDSTAMATGDGMVEWARDHRDIAEVSVVAAPGCGFVRAGEITDDFDDLSDACTEVFDEELPETVAAEVPDVVLAMVTLTDVLDRVWVEGEVPLVATDDLFVDRLTAEYTSATQRLLDDGVGKVLWVAPPTPDLPASGSMLRAVDPLIRQRYREVLAELESAFPGRAVVVDLAAWMASTTDPPDREDGLHYSEAGARELADRYLGPVVVAEAAL